MENTWITNRFERTRNMKRLCLMLSLALALSLGTAALAAEKINGDGGSASKGVSADYRDGASTGTVYSVDVTWGTLAFTYTAFGEGTWNPQTHAYDMTAGGWSVNDAGGDEITVTNHSNAAVDVTLSFAAEPGFPGVTGVFSVNGTETDRVSLPTAEGTAVEAAPSKTAKLLLNGSIPVGTTGAAIGSVTVTVG